MWKWSFHLTMKITLAFLHIYEVQKAQNDFFLDCLFYFISSIFSVFQLLEALTIVTSGLQASCGLCLCQCWLCWMTRQAFFHLVSSYLICSTQISFCSSWAGVFPLWATADLVITFIITFINKACLICEFPKEAINCMGARYVS